MLSRDSISSKTLRDLLCDDEKDGESIEAFKHVECLIRFSLFSKYPQRRPGALDSLRIFFKDAYVITATLEHDGLIRAYIKLGRLPYLFVGEYPSDTQVDDEPIPSIREIQRWAELGLDTSLNY